MEIRIGVVGKILSGDEVGSYIKVVDDSDGSTGGFYIFTAKTVDVHKGFDDWVETKEILQLYFEEARWNIEWLE